jgi:3-hydroxyisobutyrate dehydrogenase
VRYVHAPVFMAPANCAEDMKDAFSLFEHFNPGQTLPQRAKRISAGQYTPPSFEMSMARKDLRLMVEEAARGGQTLAMVPALAKLLG